MNSVFLHLRLIFVCTLLTGFAYPLLVLGAARLVFPSQAGGSLIHTRAGLLGSELIGRNFTEPHYFHPRPSATPNGPYNAALSSGSNFGPLHPDRRRPDGKTPADLLANSGSGLDPHISPAAARFQITRVAHARSLPEATVQALVDRFSEPRQFGILGEPRVNVLLLNLALDNIR